MNDSKCRTKDLVSVVISIYNYGKYICEALDGLKIQTYPHLEVIVVDDCSTDNTQAIVKQWQDKNQDRFNNFIYLKLPRNCSSAWSLNIGFQLARGEYIVIHDSDDISHKEKIEKQVKHLIKNPNIAAVGTRFQTFYDTIDKILWPAAWLSYDVKEIEQNYKSDPVKHCVSFGTLLFRADIIDTIIGCRRIPGVANDIIFVKDIVRHNYILDNLEEVLFNVRIHSERLQPGYEVKRQERNKKDRSKIKGRVSVILPVKDNFKSILKALNSIISQTYSNIEIIIVDDSSKGNVELDIWEWYSLNKKFQKIANIQDVFYFKLPISVGYPWIYNIGAYLSKGEYIVFHGNNAISIKNKIKKQVKFLKDNPNYTVVGTNFNGNTPQIKFGYSIQHEYIENKTHCVNINTIMIRSCVIDEIIGLSKKIDGREDFEFIYRLLYEGYKIENLNDVLYYEEK
ncbi:glycosyltransferase [Alkaliphilus sp. MSJ-5]|uniref:Glycosyltransferase n=1 Tax=Alkaliphilus flagellatus TaxID=2841507 RepID=A0ABS6FY48_9FIRM|nr:glycosyltransferase family 2 protein [Alkaliphilus flagellatus]MBU5675155.1 glycosyltransferase [Alkaliphilus flagellatus]